MLRALTSTVRAKETGFLAGSSFQELTYRATRRNLVYLHFYWFYKTQVLCISTSVRADHPQWTGGTFFSWTVQKI